MADQPKPPMTSLGIYDKPERNKITVIEIIAIALSVIWLAGAAIFFLTLPSDTAPDTTGGLRFLMTMLAIFMPVAMIWVAALAARATSVMRQESQRLQTAIDAIRQAYIAQQQGRDLGSEPSVSRKLDEIAKATQKTQSALATFSTTRRENDRRVTTAEPSQDTLAQPSLALGTRAEDLSPPLATEHLIRALNFPETEEDEVGFASLRLALKDRQASQLVQAAQDILTLLSQDGIYMDDLRPDRARPEIWRQFATGTRGRAIAGLGGIRDRSSLALTSGRMRQDPIFRDTAHHFLRRFDKMLTSFEPTANDEDLSNLSDTRTARAFMLLGRVAGTFD